MHRCAVAVIAVLGAVPFPGSPLRAQIDDDAWLERCERDSWREGRPQHCEIRETGLRATGRPITVDPGMNGGVAIFGWDKDSISVIAKIQASARSEAAARALARDVRIETAGGSIRADGPGATGRGQSWSVSFEVYVPRRSDLSLETVNGPISVDDVAGHVEVSAENGPLSLRGLGGQVRARAVNGPLHVELSGARWEGTGLDAETTNGPVDFVIPDGYNAEVEFGTVNGPMNLGFPITVTIQGRLTDRIKTTLGKGGPMVRVVTTNGPMTVRRR